LVLDAEDARLRAMSTPPPLDASRPSALRLAGFVVTMVAALLVGLGSIATWATVGIPSENVNTDIPGVDLLDGRVTLICAVVMLIGTLATRTSRSSRVAVGWAVGVIAAGVVSLAIAGSFLMTGLSRSTVVASLPPREMWDLVGAFREMGAGPLLVVVGGALAFVGGVLSLAWAMRGRENPAPADEPSEA